MPPYLRIQLSRTPKVPPLSLDFRAVFRNQCHPMTIAPMENDRFWAARTISEAMGAGYSDHRAICSGCGRIADLPFLLQHLHHHFQASNCYIPSMLTEEIGGGLI